MSTLPQAVAACLLLGGCAPAPATRAATEGPEPIEDVRQTAVVASRGIGVVASRKHWEGPGDIADRVTPVFLAVHNRGFEPAGLWHDNMVLVAADGRRFRHLPLAEIGAVPPAPHAWDTLPEGWLGVGERVDGFVYFEPVGSGVSGPVRLVAIFYDPTGREEAARVTVPFRAP